MATVVPEAAVTYDAAFTVLSIFTSFAGCATTLELLHRRTSTKGLFNWFLLLGACIAMGGSGIWSMHFIANRAIVLNQALPEDQILYNPGFTALSVFLPVIVLLGAFYFLGGNASKARPLYLLLAGVLTGTAVCGMHYVGNAGIRNYHCSYEPAKVAGAAVIAVFASLVALSIFFRLRDTWTDSWWKRAACAVVLTGAVCGMHWTAAVGTHYVPTRNANSGSGTTRVQTVIVCAVLSIGCCVVLLVVTFMKGRKMRLTKARAQQVVLACAYFDETGRVMVTQEGAFPCQKITDRFIEKNFGEDELSRSHPTFTWIFRASRNWSALKDLIPVMIHRLDEEPSARKYRPGHHTPTSDASSEVSINFSNIFKQLFCVAASQLSHIIHEPMDNLGVLFEEALETGTMHLYRQKQLRQDSLAHGDVENDAYHLGKGKYLFLNRQLNRYQVEKYAALGYRFASISQVSDLLARSMEVTNERMSSRLVRMKACASNNHLPPPGVHLACFMVRPSVYKSFDVLVPAMAQNHLPLSSMKLWHMTEWHTENLKKYDEWKVRDILERLMSQPGDGISDRDFKFQFHDALLKLIDMTGDMELMLNAVFSARHIQVPCRRDAASGTEGEHVDKCTLLTVRLMNTIHAKSSKDLVYVPLSFFGAQQVVEAGDWREKERWERRVRMEYGYSDVTRRMSAPVHSPPSSPWGSWAEASRGSSSIKSLTFLPWIRKEGGRCGSGDEGRRTGKLVNEDEARIVKTVEISLKEEKDGYDGIDDRDGHSPRRVRSEAEDSAAGSLGCASGDNSDSGGLSNAGDDFEKRALGGYTVNVRTGESRHGAQINGVEMVEIETGDRGGWVSEVFGMFRL